MSVPRIDVISLFPEWVASVADYGVTGRAVREGLLQFVQWNPRDYTENRHRRVDDRSFGGGPGMVMQVEPLAACLRAISASADSPRRPVILLSPQGRRFDQPMAGALASGPGAILVCGRYEGLDQRFIDRHVDFELSTGDYVLSGGELPAMIVVDALARLLPGALGDDDSAQQDSFSQGLLDHPHYTRPYSGDPGEVPAVLLSGDHQAIERWRLQQALGYTWLKRPDILADMNLSAEQQQLLQAFIADQQPGKDARNDSG